MPDIWYEANEDDCISSIALQYGLFWETVWNHQNNAGLRRLREDPNVLKSGDRVFVPELRQREESCATDQLHRFVRKGTPAMLRLFLKDGSEPRANLRYVLVIDGVSREGTTDGEGRICVPIAPDARQGLLMIFEGDTRHSYTLRLGAMDPKTEPSGVIKRLRNLGFLGTDESGESVSAALRAFQLQQNLPITGEPDSETADALVRVHRS